jgi:hypothetical protein
MGQTYLLGWSSGRSFVPRFTERLQDLLTLWWASWDCRDLVVELRWGLLRDATFASKKKSFWIKKIKFVSLKCIIKTKKFWRKTKAANYERLLKIIPNVFQKYLNSLTI